MKFKKKILSILLTAVLVFSLISSATLTAWAADNTYHIDYGYIAIAQNAGDSSKLDVTHSATSGAAPTIDIIPATDNIVITQTDSSKPVDNYIYVGESIANAVNITLNNVNIDESAKTNVNALYVATGTTVNLTLTGTNTLKSGANSAGIGVPSGATLTVTAASTGSLNANGGNYGAGIGGGVSVGNGGTVTVNGGTVIAKGGDTGAGIGGGYQGAGGTVTVNGGTVTATGGSNGAGIGGGDYGAGGTVTVNGGTVIATGGGKGAGIGSGRTSGGSSGSLYISGGSVNASSVPADVYQLSGGSTKVYKTTVIELPKSSAVTCSVNGGTEFSCATDTSGYLYLWLPVGSAAIQVNDDDQYINVSGNVAASNGNVFTAEKYVNITTSGLDEGIIGANYNQTLSATGGTSPYIWRKTGALPDGLSLSTGGIISGIPTETCKFSFIVMVTDSNGLTGTKAMSITVNQAFSIDLSALSVGDYGTLSPTFGKGKVVYSVSPTSPNSSYIMIKATTADSKATLTINGITAVSGTASTVNLSKGANIIPIVVTSPDGLSQKSYIITITRTSGTCTYISTDSLSFAITGEAYSETLSVTGDTASCLWNASGLPSGLTMNTSTGEISGTPTASGTYTVEVILSKHGLYLSVKSFTLKVYSLGTTPAITVVNGAAFTVALYDANGKYQGTDINTAYGTITGTANGSNTVLTGTLTNVPTTWTEVTLNGSKVMIRSVTAPSTTVLNPSFY